MKMKCTLAVLAAAVLLTGCWQKSISPFYKDKDIFYEEKLVGSWREAEKAGDDVAVWKFEKGDTANVYRVRIEDKETKLDCDGRLFKIGETKFLDLHSRNRGIIDAPAHTLFRVNELGESFKIQLLSPGW